MQRPIAGTVPQASRSTRVPGWMLVALLLGATPVHARTAELPALSLEVYGLDEGLSQLTVSAMSGDDQGFLWVATQDGLNRFDGHRFRTYRSQAGADAHDPGLVSSSVDSLAFERERRRMWLGTNDAGLEVVHLPSWERRRLGVADGLSHVRVTALLLDPAGGAWLGTEAGVDHIDADVRSVRPLGATEAIVGLVWAAADTRPVALDTQCQLWSVGTQALVPVGRLPGTRCMALQGGPEGLWAISDAGLHALDADGRPLRHWSLDVFDTQVDPSAMIRLDDGRVLVGFSNGEVMQLVPGQARPQRLRFDRPPRSAITRFHQNGAGAWWIGTYTSGLYRVRPLASVIRSDLAPGDAMDGWPSVSVRAIWRGDGQMLVGTDSGLHQRSAIDAPWREVAGLQGISVRAVVRAGDGGWWIGSMSGLWRLGADGRLAAIDGLPDPRIDTLLVDGDTLWVGTRGGLVRLRDGQLQRAPELDALDDLMITSLHRDRDGSLLVATNTHGLWRHDGTRLARIEPGGAGLHRSVWALHGDADAIWAGTFGGGLYRIDRATGASTVLGEREGLTNDVVYRILADEDGRLWVSTNLGLGVYDPASGLFQTLGRRDGLRNQEYNSGAALADGGRLYFGGTHGLDAIAPMQLPPRSPPAWPVLTGLQLLSRQSDADARLGSETDIVYAPAIELGSEDSVFTIGMTAIDFLAPAAAQLRYRVNGLHGGWLYPHEARTEVSLNHLPAGRYTLEVQAAGRDGQFGPSRTLTIHMPPPLWRHPLAYAGYALLTVLVLVWLVARTRSAVRRERMQVELLNRTVTERTLQLEQANAQLQQSNAQLDAANRLDPLTHVANRRELQDWLARESARVLGRLEAGIASDTLYFFMLDIDAFKRINDGHGHQAGDAVLVQFAQRLRAICRDGDLLVRWGGEEFVLVTRLGDPDAAAELAERLRAAVAGTPIPLAHGAVLPITCSIGFAPWPFSSAWPALGDWQQTSALADRCLYAAKAAGRNAWVGLVPGSAPDRQRLQALLAGADPATLGDSVRLLHSTALPPRFAL